MSFRILKNTKETINCVLTNCNAGEISTEFLTERHEIWELVTGCLDGTSTLNDETEPQHNDLE